MRFLLGLVSLLLVGCGHLTFDLKAHEEAHCREFGAKEVVYHYEEDAAGICRAKTGLIFVDGCAELWTDGTCHMWLPEGERDKLLRRR